MEEPSALVQLDGEPNRRATDIPLTTGWSRPASTLARVALRPRGADRLARAAVPGGVLLQDVLPLSGAVARVWEPFLRHMAGLGHVSHQPDTARHDKRHTHCDVLVVGAGPAGLMAALAAGRSGARVILVEADGELGGSLRRPGGIEPGWAEAVAAELTALPEVQVLTNTVVFGRYDGNYLTAAERGGRNRLWHIRGWSCRAGKPLRSNGRWCSPATTGPG